MGGVLTVGLAIIVFLLIITVHEFGHFITAKMFKVKVPEFSIGFGPAVLKKQKNDTLYSLRAFPVGGYVKLEGEDEESDDENALCNKPVWQRIIIVSAGAILNILMGFLVYVILYSSVSTMPVLTVDGVYENTPAFETMLPGDRITAVNGNKVWYYKDFKFIINTISPEEEMVLTVVRNDERLDVKLTPQYSEEANSYLIGIKMKQEKIGFLNVFKYAFFELFYVIKIIFYSFFLLISGGISLNNVAGPVGTVNVMSQAARNGLVSFMNLFAMLTVNIGLTNLLPIPALDGGRVFFMFIELLRGKPINPKKEGMVHFIGLVLLLLLMVLITVNDISVILG